MINMYSNPGLVTKERVTQTCPKCAISHLFDFSVIVLWIKLAIRGGKRAVFDNNSHFYYPVHSLTIFLDPFKPKYAQSTNVIITAFSPQKAGSWLIAPDLVNCIVKKGIKYAFSPKNKWWKSLGRAWDLARRINLINIGRIFPPQMPFTARWVAWLLKLLNCGIKYIV